MYNICEIRLWSTPPAKFNLYIFSCVTFCRKMHFYMHRHRETQRERKGERVSCTTCLWFHVKYVEKWPTLQADTFRGVARRAKTRQKLLKSLQVELACGARLYSALQTFWFTVCGRAQECLHRDWERERENAGKAKWGWSKEHSPTMLPRLASSALACLKAPEVQFMQYFISPKGKFNFSNFCVDCSPKVLSEYVQFCTVYRSLVCAIRNLKFLHENDHHDG